VCLGTIPVGLHAASSGIRRVAGQPLDRQAKPVTAGTVPSAVGVLAATSAPGVLAGHFCSAAVVNSPAGNLVITAAHCLAGHQPGQFVFVPGYDHGRAPYGIWTVRRVFTDHDWASRSDPDDDVAFLQVSRTGAAASVQSITGGESLGLGSAPDQLITVTAYPNSLDTAIACRTRTRPVSATQLEFRCGGYTEGTSGAPLLAWVNPATGRGTVIGVIGGYQLGGSTDAVSYAARLGPEVAALYRAATGQA
jgi:V8-like Glu-specific endopeptidase